MRKGRKTKHYPNQPDRKPGSGTMLLIIIIVVLAGIPFGLGKYLEFNSPDPFDSASYIYSAKRILDGARLGIDEKPSAAKGTLVVNILGVWLFGFNEFGPTLIQGILQAAALVVMFMAMRRIFGKPAAAVGVIIASVYLSSPLIAKYGNVKEQHMIAFMILGVSCLVLGQVNNRWWQTLLAGGFLVWAPLFKETGFSAIGATGLFIIVQPLLKNRTWKRTMADIGFLLAGSVIAISPLYIWILTSDCQTELPYSFVWRPVASIFAGSQSGSENKSSELPVDENSAPDKPEKRNLLAKLSPSGYVTQSWRILKPEQKKEVVRRVFRYYRLLILPIALAVGSIAVRLIKLVRSRMSVFPHKPLRGPPDGDKVDYERFVLLFAVWWLLDMAFVWVSPRSYEQYYLPLNGSAAMLGGYLIAVYHDKLKTSVNKPKWQVIGIFGVILMIIMSWHIFFGIETSPHSGRSYGKRSRGYVQKVAEIKRRKREHLRGAWEVVGEYIRTHSTPNDKIYVWGWVPGIYVKAQRLSPAPKAFEGNMHTLSPEELKERIDEILTSFKGQRLKFIVDTRKIHYPWDRPPLELWPDTTKGFVPPDRKAMEQYDSMYLEFLQDRYEPEEALRFEVMRPFREFVMSNYEIVGKFGEHVLFEHK